MPTNPRDWITVDALPARLHHWSDSALYIIGDKQALRDVPDDLFPNCTFVPVEVRLTPSWEILTLFSLHYNPWMLICQFPNCIIYRIAGIFRGVIFSWFSWSRGEPRNIYPRKTPRTRAQNRRQTARPRNFFHEIAKITTFTKILPLEKYPLYGICSHRDKINPFVGVNLEILTLFSLHYNPWVLICKNLTLCSLTAHICSHRGEINPFVWVNLGNLTLFHYIIILGC